MNGMRVWGLAPVLLLLSVTRAMAGGTVTTGTCKKASNIDFAVATDGLDNTTSLSFVDVPDMSVDFVAKGNDGCALVEYSASTFADAGNVVYVRALLDGTTVCAPDALQLSGDDDENGDGKWSRSHAFNFVCTGLIAGDHNIKIQWMGFTGGVIYVHQRSLFVHHK